MPAIGVKTGHMAERVCEVLKACRGGFVCARDVAEFCGYKKPDYARALLNKLAESGLLETRKVQANKVGPHTLEYRVASAWRNDDKLSPRVSLSADRGAVGAGART